MSLSYPKRIEQHKHESDSFAIILYKFKDIGLFRNITECDYGIDFEIEVVNGTQVEGHCLKIQVKSSDKLTILKKNGHAKVGGIKQSTLYYWSELSYNVPVVAMAVDLKNESIYVSDSLFWQAIRLIDGTDKTKSIDLGRFQEIDANLNRLKRMAYGFGLRDILNAHKWLLRNLGIICSQYENALGCDPWCVADDVVFIKSFLDNSKAFLGIQSFAGDEKVEKFKQLFKYDALKRTTPSGEFDYRLQASIMGSIFQILMPLLRIYKKRVTESAYYWAFKDPDYLKLVVTTDIPNEKDQNSLIQYGFRGASEEESRIESEFNSFVMGMEKKYGAVFYYLLV